MEDPLKPTPKRRVRGGIVVAIIVLVIVVIAFVGRNLGHMMQNQHSKQADVATHEGQ